LGIIVPLLGLGGRPLGNWFLRKALTKETRFPKRFLRRRLYWGKEVPRRFGGY